MFHWDNDAEFEPSYDERTAAELEGERVQILETQIRRDERLKLRSLKLKETPGKKKLKRELRREALTRLEDAARSRSDFEEVIAWWDKLDENRERRERDHEIPRGDVPLEYGAAGDGTIFPAFLCSPFWQALCGGHFFNIIFDCPYEMHEMLADPFLSKMVFELKEDHKELLYYKALRRYSSIELGTLLGQSDRNIRKKWARLIGQMQKRLFAYLTENGEQGLPLTRREQKFLERYRESVLDDGKDGW